MKNIHTTLVIIFLFFNYGFATVRTVSNDPAGGSQYSTLSAAYNASSNGDTLLVEGTNINYNLTANGWDKKLVVIGSGFNAQKYSPLWKATYFNQAGTAALQFRISTLGNGSKFYGIIFNGNGLPGMWSFGCNDLTFEDCYFMYAVASQPASFTNILFKNCVFGVDNNECVTLPGNGHACSVQFFNCLFEGYISGGGNSIANITVDHCLFLGTNIAFWAFSTQQVVRNSIVMNSFNVEGSSSGTTYLNNISRLGSYPSGSGNINLTDPLFVNYTLGSVYSTSHDYHLQAGSPAIGAGSDGTQIGLHGGFSNFSERGEPLIAPVVRTLIINNGTVAPNGTINVEINASKPRDY